MYKTTQGIKFEIINTDDEIIFLDENFETLTWENNDKNALLVESMVEELGTKRVIKTNNKYCMVGLEFIDNNSSVDDDLRDYDFKRDYMDMVINIGK